MASPSRNRAVVGRFLRAAAADRGVRADGAFLPALRRIPRCALPATARCLLVRRGRTWRHHGREDLLAEADVARYRAATLAHAVNFALLHVEAGTKRRVGQDIGCLEHALTAQAGDDDVGDGVAPMTWGHWFASPEP